MGTELARVAAEAAAKGDRGGVVRRVRAWLSAMLSPAPAEALSYYGATKSRKAANWTPGNKSANSEIATSLPDLRARSRYLLRNNAYAVRAVESILGNVIGDGLWPQSCTGDEKVDDASASVRWIVVVVRRAVDCIVGKKRIRRRR